MRIDKHTDLDALIESALRSEPVHMAPDGLAERVGDRLRVQALIDRERSRFRNSMAMLAVAVAAILVCGGVFVAFTHLRSVVTLRDLGDSPHDVYAVFTVQEEVGLRGAVVSAFGIEPEVALAVDVTGTGDIPESPPMAVELGAGPAVKVMDRGFLAHPGVKQWLIDGAERLGIPYQREVLQLGSTDARAIQLTRSGVPTGALSLPARYIHSPSEMVDLRDLQGAARLLAGLLAEPIDL